MRTAMALLAACLGAFAAPPAPAAYDVVPIPEALRTKLKLAPFYQKFVDVDGFPIVSSARTTDHALKEAAWIVRKMIGERADVRAAMIRANVRLVVMARNEYTTDLPEQARMRPKVYWDRRARGLGATMQNPVASCAEENLLCLKGDPYSTENILIHEFAHAIHLTGMNSVDPTFDRRLKAAYDDARKRGLWKGTYAAVNHGEYWAEAVQSWFDDNRENDSLHNHVNTRVELEAYDPAVAKLCAEAFGKGDWRYRKPHLRDPAGRGHLEGFDPKKAPSFAWRTTPIPKLALVRFETQRGTIEVELDAEKAPVTVRNFLRYVEEGLFADGMFFRTVTAANQPTDKVRIAVIQAQADPKKQLKYPPAIPLERTRDTGLKHGDGAISMARDGPDTGREHFFICVGEQPELDFGGKRNPDGQGFAAFGRVTRGMDVVKAIHAAPANEQSLEPPIRIQRAIRLN
ncbi:MAG TPA: peptidylprolyl isomerase [Planctomycetia bacterium]|nr:peptidylprolyl isomerase [Planctomycetia bacterium]